MSQNKQIDIKAVLFDIDGIVITGRKHLFSHRLSQEYNIPVKKVEEFFLNDFKKCSFGRADLKEKIAPFLAKWNWQGSVEDLLKYWFTSESTVDKEVIKIINDLRSKGLKCYMSTRQEKYRLQYLLETIGLKNYFDDVFCTCNIGYEKWQPEFFASVFKKLRVKPQEVMFFDDSQRNIDATSKMGVKAYLYKDITTLKNALKIYLTYTEATPP